jgi:lipid-A-disaccharide synthase-like uncharacterized protein
MENYTDKVMPAKFWYALFGALTLLVYWFLQVKKGG